MEKIGSVKKNEESKNISVCSFCSASFSCLDNLRRHMLGKHGRCIIDKANKKTNFACSICQCQFTRERNLKRLMAKLHGTVFKDDRGIDIRMKCNFPECREYCMHCQK